MKKVKVIFSPNFTPTNWDEDTLSIFGQYKYVKLVDYEDLKIKFGSKVSQETYKTAIKAIKPSEETDPTCVTTSSCSLHLDICSLSLLPDYYSRHDSPTRPHALTKAIRSLSSHMFKNGKVRAQIVVVCPQSAVLATGAAVSRAFPSYSAKTSAKQRERALSEEGFEDGDNILNEQKEDKEVLVEFFLVEEKNDVVQRMSMKEREANLLTQMGYAVRLTSLIVDMPCNLMSTNEFIQEIQRIGTDLGIVPKIIRGTDLDVQGFGGIYGVGKAAVNPPALVTLSHVIEGSSLTLAWVGKGIVYDTGGLSIKSKTAMPGMKRDCGGAAAILAAFYACVKMGFKHTLHAVFCLAENSVGPNATRPDDVHRLYSGKTVEINNTDAEGRLVLADGVAYASHDLSADIIIDMATLTGAQGISVGKYHAAVVTNNSQWESYSVKAGRLSGDLVFPLPYSPELHFSEFNSAIADMKNSVTDRNNAQASCAALFIASHLKNGFEYPGIWAHYDIAAPVHSGERATGYGVALLLTLFGFGSQDPYLNDLCPVDMKSLPEVPINYKESAGTQKMNVNGKSGERNVASYLPDSPLGLIGEYVRGDGNVNRFRRSRGGAPKRSMSEQVTSFNISPVLKDGY